MNKKYLTILLIFQVFTCFSQNDKINNTSQLWTEVDLLGKINSDLKWQFDLQYSRQSAYEKLNFVKYNEQLTIRPWLHYFPQKNIKISTFIGLWYNYPIKDNINQREYSELRTALQFQYYKFIEGKTISFRLRTELREIIDILNKYETVFRERIMIKYQNQLSANKYYYIIQNELFFNDGSEVTGHKLFDQNRIYLGIGYNISNNLSIETGYFNQFVIHAHNTNYDSNNILQVSLIFDNL